MSGGSATRTLLSFEYDVCAAAAVSVNWIDGYCLLSYTAAEVAAGLQVQCVHLVVYSLYI